MKKFLDFLMMFLIVLMILLILVGVMGGGIMLGVWVMVQWPIQSVLGMIGLFALGLTIHMFRD